MISTLQTTQFTQRIPELIDRAKEIELIKSCLNQRDLNHFLAFFADGGLGKTRLLEEVVKIVQEAGKGFHVAPIIDLFHTETHSSSDVESMIAEGLDPGPDHHYFENYRPARAKFEMLRERNAGPAVIEDEREALSELFIKDFNAMSRHAEKLVLCFDTIEILQYESSLVEDLVNLEKVDPRIRPWLLSKLSQLKNVLVIFAGRPKYAHGRRDLQRQLEDAMRQNFGESFQAFALEPLSVADTALFIMALAPELAADFTTEHSLPLVHKLSGGRPIYLHLLVDLVKGFAHQVPQLLDRMEQIEVDPRHAKGIEKLRKDFQVWLINDMINQTGEDGAILGRLALMPKGFTPELIELVLGMPSDETEALVKRLLNLSFIKVYKPAPGLRSLSSERLFFHDEFSQLLLQTGAIPNLHLEERRVAQVLIRYYDNQTWFLKQSISQEKDPVKRAEIRSKLQKVQVERLYYLLVRDPRKGYEEYKRLSSEANRRHSVGFAMRLLDEFLRFYNDPYNDNERRKQFERAGISHEQVIRESVQLWSERLHWLALYEQEIAFAEKVTSQLEQLNLRQREDAAIIGMVIALWGRARTMLYGYEAAVVERSEEVLNALPEPDHCSPAQLLARARLCTTIGYACRRGGRLGSAFTYNTEAIAALRKLPEYGDELGIALNNQASVCAKLGQTTLGRLLGEEGLRINESMGFDYSAGLGMANLSFVERMAGNYHLAEEYAIEAGALMRVVQDSHGVITSYVQQAEAIRKSAKQTLKSGRRLNEALNRLKGAKDLLSHAHAEAKAASLVSEIPALFSSLGKTCREMGGLYTLLGDPAESTANYHQGEEYFRSALGEEMMLSLVDRCDLLQDYAELLSQMGLEDAAEARLSTAEQQIEAQFGPGYKINPPEQSPAKNIPVEYFWSLGKIERLRGEISFKQNAYTDGLQHFLLSYTYFYLFSPGAVERERMLESIYGHLGELPLEERTRYYQEAAEWVVQNKGCLGEADVQNFLNNLRALIGG